MRKGKKGLLNASVRKIRMERKKPAKGYTKNTKRG